MLNLQPASFDHKRNRGPLTPRSRSRSLPQPPRSCGSAATTHRPACRGAAGLLPRGPPLRKARPLSPARGGSFRPTHNTLRAQNPHKKKLRKPQNEPPTRKPYPVSEKLDKFLAFLSIRDNQGAKRRGQNPRRLQYEMQIAELTATFAIAPAKCGLSFAFSSATAPPWHAGTEDPAESGHARAEGGRALLQS